MHDDDLLHSHELSPDAVLSDIEGIEMFVLRSVGIDIGSSTSHLVFSQITLRREGASLSGRFTVADRRVLFRSRIMLTPYLSGTLIDTERVKAFINEAYAEAGFRPRDIDTGAVIITGEALKKENAQPIVEFFAGHAGKFICAAAGHNHEALLAAYGCGAVDISRREKATVLNVDVGGGTTKFSLIEDGTVTGTAAVAVGARLLAFDGDGLVRRIEEPGRIIMEQTGCPVELGGAVAEGQMEAFTSRMAGIIVEMIEGGARSPLAQRLMLTKPLPGYKGAGSIDCLVFSGGVSEYLYDRDGVAYGDAGPMLGRAIKNRLAGLVAGNILREPPEGIRATVIGAGEYTIQASGNTSYISDTEALPASGLKVVHAPLRREIAVSETIRSALAKYDLQHLTGGLALSLTLESGQDYHSLRRVAEGIVRAMPAGGDGCPLYLVMEIDVAKSLGSILKEELRVAGSVIAVDGIDAGDLDYLDIGKPMGNTEVIPVTVKSLMFPTAAPAG